MIENVKFLKDIVIFRHLSPLDLIEVSKFIKKRFYRKGETILMEGSLYSTLYMIKSGSAIISKSKGKKEKLILANLNPGRYFGEFSLIAYRPASASVIACNDVETFEIKKEAFEDLIDKNKDIGIKIYKNIGKSLFEKLKDTDLGIIMDFDI